MTLVADIIALKDMAYRHHYYCEDTWYSCPKSGEGCANDAYAKDECTCQADEHNAKLKILYRKILEQL